jgi:hypothetical protein
MIIEGLYELIRMLVVEIPSWVLYLFPILTLFGLQLVFFDNLCWTTNDGVRMQVLAVSIATW